MDGNDYNNGNNRKSKHDEVERYRQRRNAERSRGMQGSDDFEPGITDRDPRLHSTVERDGVVLETTQEAMQHFRGGRTRGRQPRVENYEQYPSETMRFDDRPTKPRSPEPRGIEPRTRKRSGKSYFAAFYIVTLVCGVIICIIIFALVFNSMKPPGEKQSAIATPTPSPTAVAIKEINALTGIITAKNDDRKTVEVMDIETGRSFTLNVLGHTDMKDKHGNALAFIEFKVGTVVDLDYESKEFNITNMSENVLVKVLSKQRQLKIDTDKQTVTIGNDTYNYSNFLLVLYKGEPYNIRKINAIDTVSVTVLKDKVFMLSVEKSHGTLKLENFDYIKNPILEVNTSVYTSIAENPVLDLPEGLHKVTVSGDNIEDFVTDVNISPDEPAVVNLSEMPIKTGILNIVSNEENYTLVIDGTQVDYNEPVLLEYGKHKIRFEKDGFTPSEAEIEINAPVTDYKVDLVRMVKDGKIIVDSVPSNAEVFVDSVLVGRTPITHSLEKGPHQLVIRAEGYVELNFPVIVEDDVSKNTYNFLLQPNPSAAANTEAPTEAPTATPEPATDEGQ